ncbi:MAG: GTPase HflX [Turicibacter sp.]|nr:GTPase HflX [Turicibacter sp.]
MDEILQRAILVGVDVNSDPNFEYSMKELANLAEACEVEVVGEVTQNLQRTHGATYVGTGKVEEIAQQVDISEANLVIFNDELSPSQIRNLESAIDCKVIDRTLLILDIFAKRAKTREAQLQVEIAQLQYMKPRLVGLTSSLSRQGGGIGAKGVGEKKLELNRRRIEDQIYALNKELDHLVTARQTQRKLRKKNALPVVALVGYTNAGKSTTMNALLKVSSTDSEEKKVFEKNMLFATLETSTRHIHLADNKQFLLTDTVGFVSKLPHQLVKAFRSTLEEVTEADLLLHVVDISHPEHETQIKVTNKVLEDLGVKETPMIYAYNKSDLADDAVIPNQESVKISAKTGAQIPELLELVKKHIFDDFVRAVFLIPYTEGAAVSYLNERASVKKVDYQDNGTLMEVECDASDFERFKHYSV